MILVNQFFHFIPDFVGYYSIIWQNRLTNDITLHRCKKLIDSIKVYSSSMIFDERKVISYGYFFFQNCSEKFQPFNYFAYRYRRILIARKLTRIDSFQPFEWLKVSFARTSTSFLQYDIHFAVKSRARVDRIFLRLIVSFSSTRTWNDRKCFEGKGGKKSSPKILVIHCF